LGSSLFIYFTELRLLFKLGSFKLLNEHEEAFIERPLAALFTDNDTETETWKIKLTN